MVWSRLSERVQRWMLRVEPPEPQPIRLPQSRIYVLPTGTGLALALTLFAMLLASINYSLSLGFVLTFMLAGVMAVHALAAWRSLFHLIVTIDPRGEVFAGGHAEYLITLEAGGRTAHPGVEIWLDGRMNLIDVPAGGSAQATMMRDAPQRGRLSLGRVKLQCRHPLGWIRAWSYVAPAAEHIVFARADGHLAAPTGADSRWGMNHSRRSGNDDYAGLRTHQRSDPPRHVAWKIVARGGPMLTRQYAGVGGEDWHLDWDALMPMATEARLSQLCAWILQARTLKHRCGLKLPGRQFPASNSPAHYLACLQAIALHGQTTP